MTRQINQEQWLKEMNDLICGVALIKVKKVK
jgi:hypothetical protein